jgi:hypothetical protein
LQTYASIIASTDGISWAKYDFTSYSGSANGGSVFFNGNYLLPTNSSILIMDGSSFGTVLRSELANSSSIVRVATDGSVAIILQDGEINYTADGDSFSSAITDVAITGIKYCRDKFIAYGSKVYYSYNGSTWTEITTFSTLSSRPITNIAYSGNIVFLIGLDIYVSSDDGLTFSKIKERTTSCDGIIYNGDDEVFAVSGVETFTKYITLP